MKKLFVPAIFFVKTAVFFVYVQLVHFLQKLCFAANLIWDKKFFKNKAIFFVKTAVFFFSVCLIIPHLLLAQTSEFSISTLVGDDTTPPTTPTLLSAIPVAQTQIDLTWSASTDNFMLDGYVLLRDGLPIATTTLTTYFDTGLTASTTYSYEVYAFDTFLNISTTSNAIATTTLAVPAVPPTATSTASQTSTRVLRLLNLDITPSTNSAIFAWQTSNPARYALRWGRNDSYDDGYILNDVYRTAHQTLVGDLAPGTIYLYELIGYGANGFAVSLEKGEFKTEARENFTPPNVQNLSALVTGEDVELSWSLPPLDKASVVRIVRSHLGYPADPYDGAIVFEGTENSFFDQGALAIYQDQFYTAFVITADGSVSSGAVIKARKLVPGTATSTTPLPLEEVLIEIPDFGFSTENINLSQGNNQFNFKTENIELSQDDSFIISIPYEALPKNLKSIIVTLLDPTDQRRSYSFLLRINKDRSAYEAIIAPLRVFGTTRLQIEIFDYEREIIGRYRKQIDFVSPQIEQAEVFFPDKIIRVSENIFPIFALIFSIVLLVMFLLWWRGRQTEDNH